MLCGLHGHTPIYDLSILFLILLVMRVSLEKGVIRYQALRHLRNNSTMKHQDVLLRHFYTYFVYEVWEKSDLNVFI